jgi:5-formyltetrahydrofolate cyclo-ligase
VAAALCLGEQVVDGVDADLDAAGVREPVAEDPASPRRGQARLHGRPKLAAPDPFYVLDPATLTKPPAEAAVREVAARSASLTGVDAMRPIDLVVLGTVAVNEQGARLGKGAGYSDIELGLLTEAGLVTRQTTICTTVHELQVVEEELPEQRYDFRVDVIVTPERVIWCGQPKRPAGLDWESLSTEQVAAIPVLARRAAGSE